MVAEGLCVVATAAVDLLGFCLKAVSESVVQFMSQAAQVVTPVAIDTVALFFVTTSAVIGINGRPVSVLMPPVRWMKISQGYSAFMAN
jgi:hypothetical protein